MNRIAPADIHCNHCCKPCPFHHCVIDRVRRTGGESGFIQTAEIKVTHTLLPGQMRSLMNIGAVLLQLIQIGLRLEHEHAAVPVKPAGCQKFPCRFQIGLFNEAGHAMTRSGSIQCSATLDITKPCGRFIRRNTEGYQFTLLRQPECLPDRRMKSRRILNQVIGGQYQQYRIGVMRLRCKRRHRHCGRRIAPERLQHQREWLDIDIAQLLCHEKTVLIVANNQRRSHAGQTAQTQQRFLKHGFVADQRQKLLGQGCA